MARSSRSCFGPCAATGGCPGGRGSTSRPVPPASGGRSAGLRGPGLPGALLVLCAWSGFVFAGVLVQRGAEHWRDASGGRLCPRSPSTCSSASPSRRVPGPGGHRGDGAPRSSASSAPAVAARWRGRSPARSLRARSPRSRPCRSSCGRTGSPPRSATGATRSTPCRLRRLGARRAWRPRRVDGARGGDGAPPGPGPRRRARRAAARARGGRGDDGDDRRDHRLVGLRSRRLGATGGRRASRV